ncbi:hypothetical protein QYS49_35850 [Marivirga salinae]|uniref:Uncharacterized protein n=1 Tax=Marivirga salinarum TaxID=3059078 RepID=A0AA51N8Z3_9BACT|nr:hypothetical protein [Marivirga sp. BDSF4-3]WMN10748.1 hypothetical protein QYS49_35850 [Marivirga sp. BDSF4-3]
MIVLSSSLAFCCEEEELCEVDELIACDNEKPKSHQEDFPCSPFFDCGNCTGNIIINTPLIALNGHLKKSNVYSPFLETYLKKEARFRLLKPPMQLS